MKLKKILTSIFAALSVLIVVLVSGCGKSEYILTEKTFYKTLTTVLYYPEQYLDKYLEFDCFTYDLNDAGGVTYRSGVRKSTAEYGCVCGNDTIIGFILEYDGDIPDPVNQSSNEQNDERTWIHIRGKLKSAQKTDVSLYAYDADGNKTDTVEAPVSFLVFVVETLELVEDYSNLAFYVQK